MGHFGTIILEAFCGAIGGGLLTVIIFSIKGVWKKSQAEEEAEKNRTKVIEALAHDALFRQCRYILEQGYITDDELENLEYLFNGYHNIGLNGTGETLYKKCKDLPLKITTVN